MASTRQKKYKTKPLDCWDKAKEIRRNHYRDVWQAKEQGKLLVTGGEYSFLPLPAGLGDYEFLGGEPFGATVGQDPKFSEKVLRATLGKGYPTNMCSYMRAYWGCMFLNEAPSSVFPFLSGFIKPDFCLPWEMCESQSKWYQTVAEYYDIPIFVIDVPLHPHYDFDRNRRECHVRYLVDQLNQAIEWMEDVTGRGYDDEKLVEAVSNEIDATALWAKICELNKNIPAPLDLKTMYSLYVVNALNRYKKEAVDFYRMLYDEVQERVKNQIAGVANERFRLYHDPEPMWYYLRFFRYLEKFGVTCVASAYLFLVGTAFELGKDGSWVAAKTLEERGLKLRGRQDALRVLAESYIDRPGIMSWLPRNKVDDSVRILKDWHCDGAMLMYNRGCTLTAGTAETKTVMRDQGIPVTTYEANMVDTADFDEARVIGAVNTFMESLGLQKLED